MTLEEKVWIVSIIYVAIVWIILWRAGRIAIEESETPQNKIRRLRTTLAGVRAELETMPATNLVHKMARQADELEIELAERETEIAR